MKPKSEIVAPGNPGCVFMPVEQCQCLRCDSEIPAHCIAREVEQHDRGVIQPTRQMVTAYCPFCRIAYRLCRELRSGGWQTLDGIAIVTDPKELRTIQAMVEDAQGVIRRAS